MRWIELAVRTTGEAVDAICEKLLILGASGVTIEDPSEIAAIINSPGSLIYADDGYIESLGELITIKSYFAELDDGIRLGIKDVENRNFESTDVLYHQGATKSCNIEELLMLAAKAVDEVSLFLPAGNAAIRWKYVEDEDWANCWKKYYRPVKISDRIVISPSWENYCGKEGEIVVFLDPGCAFGTGTHSTTEMCARLLDDEIKKRGTFSFNRHPDRSGLNVLDLGCGSGILAITAAKLGAAHVDAIDIDQVAVDVARENCRINDVERIINCRKGEISDLKGNNYNIIIANIIAEVISRIATDVPPLMTRDGVFIASGIINTKKGDVLEACRKAGMVEVDEIEKDDWVALAFKKVVH